MELCNIRKINYTLVDSNLACEKYQCPLTWFLIRLFHWNYHCYKKEMLRTIQECMFAINSLLSMSSLFFASSFHVP
jgi:hypothetical protein